MQPSSSSLLEFLVSHSFLSCEYHRSINDNEDVGTVEFRKCIRVLADKVSILSKHWEESFEKCRNLEATSDQARKDLEEKEELVKTLYTKHQLGKQVDRLLLSLITVIVLSAQTFSFAAHIKFRASSVLNEQNW